MSELTIEVKCTEEEKETLVNTWATLDSCMFSDTYIECDPSITCRECVEKNIKWCVTDDREV